MPRSWLLFVLAVALMGLASYCAMVLIEPLTEQDYGLTLLTNALGALFYAAVLMVTGRSHRILQTLTAVIGCSAILTLLFATEFVLFRPLLGAGIAGILAALIIFWSVPVEGHIISRAIDRHWFIGIAIAIAIFILQFGFQSALTARP